MSTDGKIFIWLIESGQKVKTFNELHGSAETIALEFDEGFTRMYTGSTDGTIKVSFNRNKILEKFIESTQTCLI
jgi:WD40 repeat protein